MTSRVLSRATTIALACCLECVACSSGDDSASPIPCASCADASVFADSSDSATAADAPPDSSAESAPDDANGQQDGAVDSAADVDAGEDASPPLPPGNALLLPGDVVIPLYAVTDSWSAVQAIGFTTDGQTVRCLDSDAEVVWEKPAGAGSLFGGFDFDGDGWTDIGLVRTEDTGQLCGTTPLLRTSIDFMTGRTGELSSPVAPMEGICWNFSGTIYPTDQWSGLGVLFGPSTTLFAVAPYYATSGSFLAFDGSGFSEAGTFVYPSTDAFDTTYTADQPNAHGAGHSYEQYSHVANGLIVNVQGQSRLAFFTTARVLQYRVGPLGPDQLVADTPFLTANRTDLVGRDYGLVLQDPGAPRLLVLVSGTSADTVFEDMRSSSMQADPWGQIERHVTIYDLEAGALVQDRFFSYAHDGNDGYQYEGRLVYPDNPMIRRGAGMPSRLAFNVYEGGHWQLHVTSPGTADDAAVFKDWFLWDIRDMDQDGADEWVLSPSRDPSDPDVPGWYFVKWRTVFARWNEASLAFDQRREEPGVIPYLTATFRLPDRTTSRGYLYPSLTTRQGTSLDLLLWTSSGQLTTVPAEVP